MLARINYILRTYAYLVIGTMLVLVNIPTFLLVMTRKTLRSIDLSYKDAVKMNAQHSLVNNLI